MLVSEVGGFERKEGRKEVVDFIHLQMYSFSIDFMDNTFHQPHYQLESNFCTLE
jgi:hypothetical protein